MKSLSDYARDSNWMIPLFQIISFFLDFFKILFGAQRRSSFSKVSHHLGVYRFVELLHGEFEVKAYPNDHVCVCVCVCAIDYFGKSFLEI